MADVSFPRGGRERPPPPTEKELKKAKLDGKRKEPTTVASDFLFGSNTTEDKSKKRKTSSTGGVSTSKHSLLPLGGGGVVMHSQGKKTEPLIEALSFGKLAKGTKLLGFVREVHDEFAVLSLPNLLTGYMLQDGLPLTKCVQIGQCLSVSIVKIVSEHVSGGQQRRRIQVSAKPAVMNSQDVPSKKLTIRGQILSVEDHGCLVDLGFGRKGFLPFEQVEGDHAVLDEDEDAEEDTKGRILQKGRFYDFFVTNSKDVVFKLSLPSVARMAKNVLVPSSTTPTLASISPGWLVQAKMESLAKNGLCVTFFGNVFRGAVELGHLGGLFDAETRDGSTAWRDVFNHQQSFAARILAVDPVTKLIRLSIQPHLLQMRLPDSLPEVGTLIEECKVVRLDPGIGALLALPEEYNRPDDDSKPRGLFEEESFREAAKVKGVYVHISKAIDENDSSLFAKQFAPSTTHKVRILSSMNWIEGVASGACAPSIIEAHVLTHSDLKPGQLYRQVPVCAHLNGGSILVDLGSGIRGLVPPLHLFETSASSAYRQKLLKAKFAIDAKIDVRVLWVDSKRKKCLLTAKKGIIKQSETITSYEDIKLGQKATGYISKIDDRSLFVTFCNRVYGKVTARSLAAELGIEDHRENYQVGDVVTCRIMNLKKRARGNYADDFQDDDDYEEDADEQVGRAYYEVTLSLKGQGEDADGDEDMENAEDAAAQAPTRIHVKAGAVLPVKVMKIVELVKGKQKEKGGFVPGYAIVSVKSEFLVDEAECTTMLPYMECKLPYDQLADDYKQSDIESAEAMDALAEKLFTVGQKLNQRGIILTDPHKSNVDFSSGIGRLTTLSLRKKLIETLEKQGTNKKPKPEDIALPSPESHMFVGALIMGYVAQVDSRHGGFIRFLDGMTGLIPKSKGGLDLPLYGTVVARVEVIDDTKSPPKILLKAISFSKHKVDAAEHAVSLKPGDKIAEAKIVKLDFHRATLRVLDQELGKHVNVSIHCTMRDSAVSKIDDKKKKKRKSGGKGDEKLPITECHPFSKWKTGQKLKNLTVVSVGKSNKTSYVQVTDHKSGEDKADGPTFLKNESQVSPGMVVTGIVTGVAPQNKGVYIQLSPSVGGFIPALELSTSASILNNLKSNVDVGARLRCRVMDEKHWRETRSKCPVLRQHGGKERKDKESGDAVFLSLLLANEESTGAKQSKPARGDLVVGRINLKLPNALAPSLMLDLRCGFVGRCCITELEEVDEWENMPLGRPLVPSGKNPKKTEKRSTKSSGKGDEKIEVEQPKDETETGDESDSPFPHGKFVRVRVLKSIPGQSIVDVSKRSSRIEGDLDEDEAPEVGDMVNGYVVHTNKSGCFVRLARHVQGRVILKELCDGFLPDPVVSFPTGRLVVGKVKAVSKAQKKSKKATDPFKIQVDLDMRESTLLEDQNKLKFDDIEIGKKYKGTVTRVEQYGVFVRIENSDVSGLVHKSECSDNYIKNLEKLFDPGDLVKILVVKKETEEKRIGFSMKASHFEDDEDSDASSIGDSTSDEEGDHDMMDMDDKEDDGLASDDDNLISKLAAKIHKGENDDDSEDNSASEDDSEGDSDSDEKPETKTSSKGKKKIDTDVGFDWGPSHSAAAGKTKDDDDSSDDSDSDDADADADAKSSHKSKKKQAQRRREEKEITRRETALADGTADENPETAADFERLIAGNPNSSEIWIRYMAFHLSLADIPSARAVAERAFGKIEFRQEKEKLNVWTALLTLEYKYGNEDSLQATVDRACQHNNPKQVYLRVCEILEKDAESTSAPDSVAKADAMFTKMCKKFKSKKKVWIAHLQYLLKLSRHQEAHALLKRALMSLASYKHAETMTKFAQLEFEFGSAERARTVFGGILLKYPKRLDLFFVYLDKEVKFGKIEAARAMLEKKVHPSEGENKLSDKQMKSLFKKWYRIEEQHGDNETQERVKDTARAYVQQGSNK